MKREIIELINRLPNSDDHIFYLNGEWCVTQEWLCGTFAGRGFYAETVEMATDKLIEYLHKHKGHDSIVGLHVDESGFPNLKLVESYCLSFFEETP